MLYYAAASDGHRKKQKPQSVRFSLPFRPIRQVQGEGQTAEVKCPRMASVAGVQSLSGPYPVTTKLQYFIDSYENCENCGDLGAETAIDLARSCHGSRIRQKSK